MATPHPHNSPVGPDTLITVKVTIDGTNRRFKLALRDLSASILPQKLRFLLAIPPEHEVRFDRFSDSAGTYITLDSDNPAIYKQLYRAAKAKLKLRLRATVTKPEIPIEEAPEKKKDSLLPPIKPVCAMSNTEARQSFLETVLSQPTEKSFSTLSKPVDTKTCAYSPQCAVPGAFEQLPHDSTAKPTREDRPAAWSIPTVPNMKDFPVTTFSIDCNACGKAVPNEHYHCSTCDDGDFDLCKPCVDAGVTCEGDEHWLIKRTIQGGAIVPSFTETLLSKKMATRVEPADEEERTCNSCISQLPSREFVTCEDCPDFDLCIACFKDSQHGHNPAHGFRETVKYAVDSEVRELLAPGRNVYHEALCDGCDQAILGVRHKCLSCPDFDYCSGCISSASENHPGHRFAPLYVLLPASKTPKQCHRGIFCDGPLCKTSKRYITGDRYKCAVCHDTDFCSSCEAMPQSVHNPSHPLVKIKIPLRQVHITTEHTNDVDDKVARLGDKPLAKHASTETIRCPSTHAATQVQTVAEVKPAESLVPVVEEDKPSSPDVKTSPKALAALYVSDSTPDGTKIPPQHLVSQSWTLRNPGPDAWPAGCVVHYIGGDDMRNLDKSRPSSVGDIVLASRSNVVTEAVEPGKTAVFTVVVRSPPRPGKFISYWRLKTPGGLPFGHKLWIDIEVSNAATEDVKPTPVDLPIRTSLLPAARTEEENTSASSSTMIFPKLDKESPVSSVHNLSEELVAVAPAVAVEPTTKANDMELLDDVESLELEDTDSDDTEILTDEEYDILDASDDDFWTESTKTGQK